MYKQIPLFCIHTNIYHIAYMNMVVKHQVGGTCDDDWSLKIKNKKTPNGHKIICVRRDFDYQLTIVDIRE